MKTIGNFPCTSIALAIITLITIPLVLGNTDNVLSGAIIQAGWCVKNDSICLVRINVFISIIVLVTGFILDLSYSIYQ